MSTRPDDRWPLGMSLLFIVSVALAFWYGVVSMLAD